MLTVNGDRFHKFYGTPPPGFPTSHQILDRIKTVLESAKIPYQVVDGMNRPHDISTATCCNNDPTLHCLVESDKWSAFWKRITTTARGLRANDYAFSLNTAANEAEVMPAPHPADNGPVVDILQKDLRNLYFLGSKIGVFSLPHETTTTIQPHAPFSSYPQKWDTINWRQATQWRLEAFLQSLQQEGLCQWEGDPRISPPSDIHDIRTQNKPTSCVFCSGRFLEEETILKTDHLRVVFNTGPYIGKGERETEGRHFLVMPTSHCERAEEWSKAAVAQLQCLLTAMTKAGKKLYPDCDVKIWMQNGVGAAQTVPHSHLHVLFLEKTGFLNSTLYYLLHLAEEAWATAVPRNMQNSNHFAQTLTAEFRSAGNHQEAPVGTQQPSSPSFLLTAPPKDR